MTPNGTLLSIQSVSRRFGAAAVAGVSLDISENELFTLLGASGSSKTTLPRMLAGSCSTDTTSPGCPCTGVPRA